jgi:hypothetical protein
MAEYQYYVFLALDRPLKAEEIAEVRSLSSRVHRRRPRRCLPTPTAISAATR